MTVPHKIFDQLNALAGFLSIFAPVVPILIALWALVSYLPGLVTSLASHVDQASQLMQTSGIGAYLGQANRIVPLSELFSMIVVLMGTRIVCTIIRLIKGWIPTLG